MKKLLPLFTLCTALFAANAHAQKARVGFTAGATLSSYKIKAESVSVTSKSKPGITIGVTTDIPLGQSGSLMTGLNCVQKGGTFKAEGMKDKLTFNYLEVPVNFVYNAKLTNGKFFIGGGPSLNVGIKGKDKWEADGTSGSDKVKFGKDKDFRRLEGALNIVSGYVAKSGLMLSVNYNHGITNSIDAGDEGGKFYNRYFGLRIGHLF